MTDVLIPTDDAPSRLDRGRRSSMDMNPDDISVVDAKVRQFWGMHPDGRIETNVDIRDEGDTFVVTAHVWTVRTHAAPDATGTALRTYDENEPPFGLFPLESAETVAIGRALRFLNITGEGS